MSEKSNRNNRIIIIVLLLALVFSLGGLYKQKQDTIAVVTDLSEEKAALQSDLSDLVAQYDALILDNDSMSEELIIERKRIIALKDSVSALQGDVSRLSRYRNEVYQLKKEKAVLLAQADSLIIVNETLAAQKAEVEAALTDEKELTSSLSQEKSNLEQKVSRGQVLNAVEILAGAIKETGSGNEKEVTKAKKADRIKTCFVLAKNEIARPGDKVIYLRVTDPEGMLIGQSMDEYAVNYNGEMIVCSEKQTIIYNNEAMDMCMYLDRADGQDWMVGTYKVEVYAENELIGTSQFSLEKGLF